jgi:hypothetical protein
LLVGNHDRLPLVLHDLDRWRAIAGGPAVVAVRHFCVRLHASARKSLAKLAVPCLPVAEGVHVNVDSVRHLDVIQTEERQAPYHLTEFRTIEGRSAGSDALHNLLDGGTATNGEVARRERLFAEAAPERSRGGSPSRYTRVGRSQSCPSTR